MKKLLGLCCVIGTLFSMHTEIDLAGYNDKPTKDFCIQKLEKKNAKYLAKIQEYKKTIENNNTQLINSMQGTVDLFKQIQILKKTVELIKKC